MSHKYTNIYVSKLARARGLNIVVTGGPSVGKSTLAEWLASIGAVLRPEMASILIQAANKYLRENGYGTASADPIVIEKFKEFGLYHPMVDNPAFQKALMHGQEELERGYVHRTLRSLVCFDRAIPDNWAYCDHYGLPYPEGFDKLTPTAAERYDICFLLHSFNRFVDNGIRVEKIDAGLEFAKVIGPRLGDKYRQEGVPLIEVPAFSHDIAEVSIQQRKDFMWQHICDHAERQFKALAA